MQTVQKWLLIIAVTGLVIGIPVTSDPTVPAPEWTLALPVGVVFLGLFLLSVLWHKEIARFDEEERLRFESARRFRSPLSDTSHHGAEESLHAHG